MSEMQPCGGWYCQKAAGFKRFIDGEDVDLYPRKGRSRNPKRDTQEYDELVEQMVEQDREDGWSGWIAPEAHKADPGYGDAWHWSFPNDERYMEAIYFTGTAPELREQLMMHKGLGWQFPILIVVLNDDALSEACFDLLAHYKVPYLVLSDVEEMDDEEEPDFEPDFYDSSVIEWLSCEADMTMVEAVYHAAALMSRTWRGGKHRKQLRKYVVKPLNKILYEEDE